MADEQRTYIVPLRREWLKVPIYKRTRKAVRALRAFIAKHMKTENVKIGKHLNLKLWSSGNRNPPHKIEVVAYRKEDKDEGKYVIVELPGVKLEEKKKEETKNKLLDKLKKEKEGEEKEVQKEKEEAEKVPAKAEEEVIEKESKAQESEVKEKKEKPRPKKEEGFAKHEGIYSRDDKKPVKPKSKKKKAKKK